jgi:hypothetical protein
MWFPAIRVGKCLIAAILVAGLLMASGCTKKSAGLGPLTMGSVKGKVTIDGSTLPAGCTVSFIHKEKSFPAKADIAADGTYTLLFNGRPQIPTGTWEVAVLPPKAESGPAADPSNPEAYKAMMMSKGPISGPATKIIVPAKYLDAAKSGLTCTVIEGQETVFDIPLKSGN